MHPGLDTGLLSRLREPRPYPAVSLVMPTHRREPDNAQDPVRLRNLLDQAETLLRDDPDVTAERRADVLGQLEQAVAGSDLAHAEDGLVLYAAPGEHHVWSVAREVPERVVVSDTFLTRNLVAAHAAEQPYWALTVAADRVTLWDGGAAGVTEHRGGGFPLARSLEEPDVERKERVGDVKGTFRDEQTRRFLRGAHEALRSVLVADDRPLFVLGGPEAVALFTQIGPLPERTMRIQRGGLADGPGAAVLEAVRPALSELAVSRTGTVVDELDTARGRARYAGGLDEVWQAVGDGRLEMLAVEEHYRTVVHERNGHLEPAGPADRDARADIVDEVVERALDTGAAVHFVPDDTLRQAGRIAAALRY